MRGHVLAEPQLPGTCQKELEGARRNSVHSSAVNEIFLVIHGFRESLLIATRQHQERGGHVFVIAQTRACACPKVGIDHQVAGAIGSASSAPAQPAGNWRALTAPTGAIMNMNIRKIWVLIFLGAFVAAVSGCNTVKGVGKDTEKAGEAIQREAEDARN